jgi:hypothetical protein
MKDNTKIAEMISQLTEELGAANGDEYTDGKVTISLSEYRRLIQTKSELDQLVKLIRIMPHREICNLTEILSGLYASDLTSEGDKA